jgi:hypothetical protein
VKFPQLLILKLRRMKNESTLTATPNHSKRTFTIRKNGSKYRTMPMSKEEFEEAEMNTKNDWNWFLRSNEYKPIR